MRIARIREDGATQPLEEHALAVGDLAASYGRKVGLAANARLSGLLHDIGKSCDEFQNYITYCHANPEDRSLRGLVPHSTQGARYLYEKYGGRGAVGLAASIVALVVACHHVGLTDCVSPSGTKPFYERLTGEGATLSYEEVVEQLPVVCSAHDELDEMFEMAVEEIHRFAVLSRSRLARAVSGQFALHLLVRLLYSCLIDADRYDAYRFEAGLPNCVEDPRRPPWEDLQYRLEKHLSDMDSTEPINQLRSTISRRCKEAAQNPGGFYELSVPTGGGKTLSSLRFALEHARVHSKDRIIYAVPFTTIIDQNADEIRNIIQRDDLILEHHSNVLNGKRKSEQKDSSVDEPTDRYRLLAERWDSPIILTTMVQFLDTLFSGRTSAARRMHRLANSVLILDEVQSTPLKCIHLLNGALNFLGRLCGATIVLCTATQPQLRLVKRPLLVDDSAQIITDVDAVFRSFKRTRLVDARVDGGYSVERLGEFTMAKMEGLRTGLVVLNTVRHALDVYHEVRRRNRLLPKEFRYRVYHLSTRLCPAHRKEILKEIRGQLSSERVLCISTQLIEAGVNLSFQCVIRALAGLDSVAQAAGRCNRHAEDACRDVYVIDITDEDLRNLPSIEVGRDITRRILNEIRSDPDAYGADPLSPTAMQQYFKHYFFRTESRMDYPVPAVATNATLYDLLGSNLLGRAALKDRREVIPPLAQAFGTAGEHFRVIEDGGISVLVSYSQGEALIEQLRKEDLPINVRNALLRVAQQYSVSVFQPTLDLLEKERAIEVLPGGVLALDKLYYNWETGVTTNGRRMEALFV